jgi:glucuronosyltransferase
MKSISKKFKDTPITPLELAKFWVEYVIRNDGAEHLKSAALDLTFIQSNSLDILAFLLLIICTITYLVWLGLRKLCGANKSKKQKKL